MLDIDGSFGVQVIEEEGMQTGKNIHKTTGEEHLPRATQKIYFNVKMLLSFNDEYYLNGHHYIFVWLKLRYLQLFDVHMLALHSVSLVFDLKHLFQD